MATRPLPQGQTYSVHRQIQEMWNRSVLWLRRATCRQSFSVDLSTSLCIWSKLFQGRSWRLFGCHLCSQKGALALHPMSTKFASISGARLNALLLKVVARHSLLSDEGDSNNSGNDAIDNEAVGDAAVSLYYMSHRILDVMQPSSSCSEPLCHYLREKWRIWPTW